MLLTLLFAVTIGGAYWLFVLGRRGATDGLVSGIAGGLGAGLGICWKFAMGLNGAGFVIETAFLAGGILAIFGAYAFGKHLHQKAGDVSPETFK